MNLKSSFKIMRKYKIKVTGWEYEIRTKNVSSDEVNEIVKDGYVDFWSSGSIDPVHEIANLSINKGLYFTVFDDKNIEVLSFNSKEYSLKYLSEVLEDDNAGFKDIGIDPEWSDEYENTLIYIVEYRGSSEYFYIDSDVFPTQQDISILELCVEGSEGDYDLLDSIAFKGIALERAHFDSGEEVDGCVKIFTADGNIITLD
tara:strand:+ start:1205 stop:1807 length:603 start_codon:yes stop_codon:yes gene_type:complete